MTEMSGERTKIQHGSGRNPKCGGQYADVIEGNVALAPLNAADVRPRKATFERKALLRPAARLAELDKAFSKQGKGVVLHQYLDRQDIEAYGFDLFKTTLYDCTYYE